MRSSTIPAEIRALGLPDLEGVIVIGGAYLELLGVREAADIDIAVSKENWEYLRDTLHWNVFKKGVSLYMRDPTDRFDVWDGWYDRKNSRVIHFSELIENSVLREEGFRVPTIDYQVQLKQWDGRDKDIADIELLYNLT